MKIYYERDQKTGCCFLQWSAVDGQAFSAFLNENGRRPVVSPAFGRYHAKGWLALTAAELERIKSKGVDDKDNRPLEFQEILPGKVKGETFAVSFGSFIKGHGADAYVFDQDPAIAQKQAGDILDAKARTIAEAEGISYAAAFQGACRENPEAFRYYRD